MDCGRVRTLVHRYVSPARGWGGRGWAPGSDLSRAPPCAAGVRGPGGSRSSGRGQGAGEARGGRTSGVRRRGPGARPPAPARAPPATRGEGAARRGLRRDGRAGRQSAPARRSSPSPGPCDSAGDPPVKFGTASREVTNRSGGRGCARRLESALGGAGRGSVRARRAKRVFPTPERGDCAWPWPWQRCRGRVRPGESAVRRVVFPATGSTKAPCSRPTSVRGRARLVGAAGRRVRGITVGTGGFFRVGLSRTHFPVCELAEEEAPAGIFVGSSWMAPPRPVPRADSLSRRRGSR